MDHAPKEQEQSDERVHRGLADLTTPAEPDLGTIEIPELKLPKGGGALRGIDEKFIVNPSNGTASMTISLALTPNRGAFTPKLALRYSSGRGNGPFGLGWDLDLAAIQRKTDNRLPRYLAGEDEDVFILAGAEDLVPVLEEFGPDDWRPVDFSSGGIRVRAYRPRVAGDLARIERIDHPDHGQYWKVTDRGDVVTIYGRDANARIADPAQPARIFRWLPELSFDNKGNWIRFHYKSENLDRVPDTPAERQRRSGLAGFTNAYPKRVEYGNHTPYFPDSEQPYDPPLPTDLEHHFEVVFDYGEHDEAAPLTAESPGRQWEYRPDAFSSYRSGFDIRTARLCKRVLMFHHFPAEALGSDCLVRSLDFTYEPSSADGVAQDQLVRLIRAEQAGYIRREDGSYSRRALPPLEFGYQSVEWDDEVHTLPAATITDAPVGLLAPYRLVDLYGEGVPGILSEIGQGWYFKRGRGRDPATGALRYEAIQALTPKPSVAGMATGAITLEDLDADGCKQIVVNGPSNGGYFELEEPGLWQPFRSFEAVPNVDLRDPAIRRIDLTGDGSLEIVVAEEEAFVWYESAGRKGFGPAERALRSLDEEHGPALVFSEAQQSVFLADMTGDGLTDLVRIRNGEVAYWPNLGYGRFGAKVAMAGAPLFDHPERFDPSRIRLADVTGTGSTDILYFGGEAVRAWLNQAGNGWSAAVGIGGFAPHATNETIEVVDLFGQGTPCLVLSSYLPHAGQSLRYVDLMGGRKPHLLTSYVNNLGKQTRLKYRSSVYDSITDRYAGRPWATRLPFPVHVVSEHEIEEHITGMRISTRYSYHHGYWDATEREFRGFGRVDRIDVEDFESSGATEAGSAGREQYQPPTLTRTWYHVGAWRDQDRFLRQYAGEYWQPTFAEAFPGVALAIEPTLPEGRLEASPTIADAGIVDGLSPGERREAMRACKSLVLRQETFALDAPASGATEAELIRQAIPFSVAEHSCHIQLMQPRGPNQHAVFMVLEDQALKLHYEREPADPRISHAINLAIDERGNVLEKAEILYGRAPAAVAATVDALRDSASDFVGQDDDAQLRQALADALTRVDDEQSRDWVRVTRSSFTNDVDQPDCWRTRLPAEVEVFEIVGLPRADRIFSIDEFTAVLSDAVSQPIAFHATPPAGVSRRLIEHKRTEYYDEALTGPLPMGTLPSHGLAYRGLTLAYGEDALTTLFGARIGDPATTMTAGGYVSEDGGTSWWIPSGTVRYADPGEAIADIRDRFFKPRAHIDPFGAETRVSYHKDYFLLLEETVDAVANRTRVESFNFRLLRPETLRDGNDNLSGIISDELGLVRALALFGKDLDNDGAAELLLADTLAGISADSSTDAAMVAALLGSTDSLDIETHARQLLGPASFRFIYDLDAWVARGEPAVSISISRTRHHAADPASPLQISYNYTDGSGALAMTKALAEPGIARQAELQPDGSVIISEVDTSTLVPPRPRWIGSGRKVLNNKGRVVEVFEPFFALTPSYETAPEMVAAGISTVHTYDAADRLVRSDLPDGTLVRTEYSAWQTISHDPGDTVLESRWYHERRNRLIDAELLARGCDPAREQQAAIDSEAYSETPARTIMDPMGRPIVAIEHGGTGGDGRALLFPTSIVRDILGNVVAVHDPRNNQPMAWRYDMVGRRNVQTSMDAGSRWTLSTVAAKPLMAWDERDHEFEYTYDPLHRPTSTRVRGGDGPAPLDHVVMLTVYGEGQIDDRLHNLRGRVFRRWDTGGLEERPRYDAQGNLKESARRFAADYRTVPDWSGDLEAPLELERHASQFTHDAINRLIETVHPDGSRVEQRYNEAGLLDAVDVQLPGEATMSVVADLSYDSLGRRQSLRHGNGTETSYAYDPFSLRLIGLRSRKSDAGLAQDLHYTHDVAGNLTHLEDKAIPAVFFDNTKIEAVSRYTYDALYRLIRADGREHAGQVGSFGINDNFDGAGFAVQHQPGDPMAWRTYTENYRYDASGNIRRLVHSAGAGSYTRNYAYEAASNRLASTTIGGDTYTYDTHPTHGFLREMPHLPTMRYDFRDRLSATSRQRVTSGTGETTYYVYDERGHRIRKITDRAAAPDAAPQRKNERRYLGGFEVYREFGGQNDGLERTTLSVMDGERRVAMFDRRNAVDDGTPVRVARYQLSNHVGSAVLELDDTERTLGYEEYHPYGTTAYQATDVTLQVAARRYRYSGMERDEETGLSYHTARYYIPWLARWTRPDPAGLADGINDYQYVSCNPIRLSDPNGKNGWDRFLGGLKMVGGALETVAGGSLVVAGVATSEFGVGVLLIGAGAAVTAHGADVTVSGARTMWEGEQVDTFTSQGMQELGMERSTANLVDAGISVVGSLGASAVTRAPTVASAAAGGTDEVVANAPTALEAVSGAAGATDEAASVTLAFSPGLPTGHNIVGVTSGGTTRWSHLVVDELATTSGGAMSYVPRGTGASVQAWTRAAAPSGYLTTTVPVTTEGAAAASRLISASEGAAGTYSYLGNNCTTYATSILREAGVVAPATTPAGALVTTALQSPTVVTTVAVGSSGSAVVVAAGQSLMSEEPDEPMSSSMSSEEPNHTPAPQTSSTTSDASDSEPMSSEEYGYCSAEGYYNVDEQVCYSQ